MFDGFYYYNGELRENLFFGQPNFAGMFIVYLIVLLWGVLLMASKARLLLALAVVAEVVAWYFLFKTYSRGAFVAVVGVGVILYLVGFCSVRERDVSRRVLAAWGNGRLLKSLGALRVAWVVGLLLLTGFADRVSPGYVLEDKSVVNRGELWEGGLKMLCVRPISGWGEGMSAEACRNWFLNADYSINSYSLVNSYITFAVEYGLVWFCVVVFCVFFAILTGIRSLSRLLKDGDVGWRIGVAVSLFGCVVAFSIGSLFTVLYYSPLLFLVFAVSSLGLIWIGNSIVLRGSALATIAFSSLVLSGLACSGLYGFGTYLVSQDPFKVTPIGDCVRLDYQGSASYGGSLYVLPDPRVLGVSYGNAIRELGGMYSSITVEKLGSGGSLKMADTEAPDVLFVFGSQFSRYVKSDELADVSAYIVHPIGKPTTSRNENVAGVLLPGWSLPENRQSAWEDWAEANKVPLFYSEGVGTDIRSVWPEAFLRVLAE